MAAVLACGPLAALSHWDGAALRGFGRASGPIHVSVRGRSGLDQKQIVVHRPRKLTQGQIAVHDGIPVTSVPWTLLDIAWLEYRNPIRIKRALEEADRLGLLVIADISEALEVAGRRRGAKLLRTLINALTLPPPTRSELEALFAELTARSGFPPCQTNVAVLGYEVDVFWPAHRLIVELDGWAFHGGRQSFERDRERDARLTAAGYEVLRFTWRQINDRSNWVASVIRSVLQRRGPSNPGMTRKTRPRA